MTLNSLYSVASKCVTFLFFVFQSAGAAEGIPKKITEELHETLTDNVYIIKSMAYNLNLPSTWRVIKYSEPVNEGRINELQAGFRFIKRDRGVCIQHIVTSNCLSYSYQNHHLTFETFSKDQEERFIWEIHPHSQNGSQVCTAFYIRHPATKSFLSFHEQHNSNAPPSYFPSASTKGEPSNPIAEVDYFDEPTCDPYLWRFHPFYPEAGYSDFLSIARDFGEVMVGTCGELEKVVALQFVKTSPHDRYFLNVHCTEKTHLNLRPGDRGYRPYRKEIYGSQDILDTSQSAILKISRTIETEEIFQTSIQNSLSVSEGYSEKQAETAGMQEEDVKELSQENMVKKGFAETLNTRLSVSLKASSETASSFTQSNFSEEETNKSQRDFSRKETEDKHAWGVSAGGGIFGWKVKASYKGEHNEHSETEQERLNQERQLRQEQKTSTNELKKVEGKKEQSTKGHIINSQDKSAKTTKISDRISDIKTRESSSEQTFSLQRSINVSELCSRTKRKSEKWEIVREIRQSPGTEMQVKFYEKGIEVNNYDFTVDLVLSGHIGYKFEKLVRTIKHDPYLDDCQGGIWYFTPATIIKRLPAPGYKANSDGSVTYKARGKLNLTYPVNVFTEIREIKKPTQAGASSSLNQAFL